MERFYIETYTIILPHSTQMLGPPTAILPWGAAGCGVGRGASTCRNPDCAAPNGDESIPDVWRGSGDAGAAIGLEERSFDFGCHIRKGSSGTGKNHKEKGGFCTVDTLKGTDIIEKVSVWQAKHERRCMENIRRAIKSL